MALGLDILYLGDYTPKEELIVNFMFELDQIDLLKKIVVVEFNEAFFVSNNNLIPISRLYMNSKNEKININYKSYKIDKNKLIEDAIGYFIPFTIILEPIDKPGTYKNIIRIKTEEGTILLEKELVFKVNSWARYELKSNNHILITNSDLSDNKVKSNGEIMLKIASNSKWELYGMLDNKGEKLRDKLIVYLSKKDVQGNRTEESTKININPEKITTGRVTVDNNNYWTELSLFMEITDIKNIEAGTINFPVIFSLKTID